MTTDIPAQILSVLHKTPAAGQNSPRAPLALIPPRRLVDGNSDEELQVKKLSATVSDSSTDA